MRSIIAVAALALFGLAALTQPATARDDSDAPSMFRVESVSASFSVVDADGIVTDVLIRAHDRMPERSSDPEQPASLVDLSIIVLITVVDPNCTPDGGATAAAEPGEGCTRFSGEALDEISAEAFQVDNQQLDGARLTATVPVVDGVYDPPPTYQVTLDVTWVATGDPVTLHDSTLHYRQTSRAAQVTASLADPTGTVDLQMTGTGAIFSLRTPMRLMPEKS